MSSELTFGEWLEDAYLRAGFTQEEFAAAVGISQSAVSNWVNGVHRPRRRQVPEIARVLGVTDDEVIRRAELHRPRRRDDHDSEVPVDVREFDLSDPLLSISAANAHLLTDDQKRLLAELIQQFVREGRITKEDLEDPGDVMV